ncbi:predicted protein [Sclerotinia sclerotiorum 1980 UF-70]|uniref:Uncharacterized protein n=1 Tax=Sclerotinia sclerotiorum (strain ATCC 18683 / 1980 / Ss-1) TaxID=665079 RepID=A7E690_SCLS1|nr:predicted protein [Sclerotinia sclerotiorum 1980 UF-70]EDN91412.1 predicted protein [Sclerotinia sclerotiorum 1980 UF-70]
MRLMSIFTSFLTNEKASKVEQVRLVTWLKTERNICRDRRNAEPPTRQPATSEN